MFLEITQNCRPCPEFSHCKDGGFECIKNYIKEGYECIEDKAIIQRAYNLLHRTEDYIVEKSIKQHMKDRTQFFITLKELTFLFRDSDAADEKLVELLESGKSSKILLDFKNGERVFVAKAPFLGIKDLIEIFWEENFYYIVAGFLLLSYTIFKLIVLKNNRILNAKANHMYELIRNQLKANVDESPEHGVPEEDLKEAIISHLGSQTASILWPIVENLRKKDKQVSKFEIHLAGRPQILWQWKDIRSLKPNIHRK